MSNPYAPEESSADLWLERSNLAGTFLGTVAYGVHLVVFALCAHYLLHNLRGSRGSRNAEFLLFIFVMFSMATLDAACNMKLVEKMWIDNRNFPGGPLAWASANFGRGPLQSATVISWVITNFLADGLVLWRTYAVWNTLYIIVLPTIMYLASTILSILIVVQVTTPNSTIWGPKPAADLYIAYFSLSISLSTLLTVLIVGRLLYASRSVKKVFGDEPAKVYTSVAVMIIESAAPYTVVGLLFVIAYACNNKLLGLLNPLLSQIMCISPEMIILRVAKGRAWTSNTIRPPATHLESRSVLRHTAGSELESPTSIGLMALRRGADTASNGSATMVESKYPWEHELSLV